jgi:transposase-like protein
MKIFLALIFLLFAFAVLGFNEVPPGDKLWVPLTQIVGGLTVIYFIWLVWIFIRGLLGRVGITKTPKIENLQDSKGYSKLVGTETRENSTAEEKMTNKRKSYTDDFKKEVAEAASKPGATLKSVGDQFDVNPTLVRNWKIQFASSSGSNGGDAVAGDANNAGELKINAGWEERDGRTVCRWIVVWSEASEGEIAGALGGYSGGGSFQMEQFFAKHDSSELTNLMIDIEDKITGEDIDFFDDIPSDFLTICDDAQDVIMEWHDEDEWENSEQLLLLDDKIGGLDKSGDMLLLNGGDSGFNKTILELAGVTAAPISSDADNNGLVNDRGGSEKTGMPIKCVARVKGAVGDLEEGTEIPQEFKDAQDLWSDVTDEETGKKILELLNPYLSANFTPHALDESENIIQTQDDISAIEVILSGFHYDGDLIPSINATAIFEVPFKSDVTNDDIERWAQENDEDFGFAVNFYWNFKDAEMYLDTHSGIEFWTADSSDQTSVDMTSSENPEGNENIFIWHIDRAKFLFEDASEYEAWKKEKKVYFEMDPSGSDDGGEKLFDDPSDGYAEFEIDDNNGNVSISLDDDGPVITAWVKWSPNLRDGVGEDEVLEWGADMGGWYAGTISLGDVDASISEDDGGDIRSSAE